MCGLHVVVLCAWQEAVHTAAKNSLCVAATTADKDIVV